MPAPLVVVSPHFDDAALSCTSLFENYPGAVLLTVFGGGPASVNPITSWDRCCGFSTGDNVVGRRRQEDENACDRMGATPLVFDQWDSQYRSPLYGYTGPSNEDLPRAIEQSVDAAFRRPGPANGVTRWAAPLGIVPDHIESAVAVLEWAKHWTGIELFVYEDQPYAAEPQFEERRRTALERLDEIGYRLRPSDIAARGFGKADIVASYESQARCLGERVQTAIDTTEVIYTAVLK